MANYVDYEYELEVYNPETDEYDYPVINVEVVVYRERDYDGSMYTTGYVKSVEEGYELSKSDEEYIVDEVIANHSWD
jgi:hypothetical protein